MKYFLLTATATLSALAIATPASAALFSWDVEYTGWWEEEGGGSVSGSFVADDADAANGIVALDDIQSWTWDWSGNDFAAAFAIASSDEGAEIQIFDAANSGFYVDGTPNQPGLLDGLDQGTFVGGDAGELILDLEFLIVENSTAAFPAAMSEVSIGNVDAASGSVTVGEPEAVPEPATMLGLIAVGAGSLLVRKRVA